MWQLIFSEKADKQLSKMDASTRSIVLSWLLKNLDGCENPRLHGKALTYGKKGYWRYRIGSYRAIADIQDNLIRIEIINVDHRRQIYESK